MRTGKIRFLFNLYLSWIRKLEKKKIEYLVYNVQSVQCFRRKLKNEISNDIDISSNLLKLFKSTWNF